MENIIKAQKNPVCAFQVSTRCVRFSDFSALAGFSALSFPTWLSGLWFPCALYDDTIALDLNEVSFEGFC